MPDLDYIVTDNNMPIKYLYTNIIDTSCGQYKLRLIEGNW